MSFLDSLLENMTVRTRGLSTERITFMDALGDEPSRRMMSKSLSKIGKTKEILNRENETQLKAIYKLGLLFSKKLRTINFNFFVSFEEYSKQAKQHSRQLVLIEENRNQGLIDDQLTQNNQKQQVQDFDIKIQVRRNSLDKMVQNFQILNQKQFTLSNKQAAITSIKNQSAQNYKMTQASNTMTLILRNHKNKHKLNVLNILKLNSKNTEKIQLFLTILTWNMKQEQHNRLLMKQTFNLILEESRIVPQKLDMTFQSKELTEDYSLMSLKQRLKELKRQTPVLSFNLARDELLEIQSEKSSRTLKILNKDMKSPSMSVFEPETSINTADTSQIFAKSTQKQLKCIQPLKLHQKSQTVTIPKQEDRFGFFSKYREHIPQQLHKLHPHQLVSDIHDTTEPFGLFDSLSRQAFKQSNQQLSRPKSQHNFNKTKKHHRVINLKGSFIEPAKKFEYPYCPSTKKSKVFKVLNIEDERKALGLKSSRGIKESCVGEEWERIDFSKLTKTQSFTPSKSTTVKGVSTSRPKCINSISIVKAELFSRYETAKGRDNAKRITSICSEMINRIRKC